MYAPSDNDSSELIEARVQILEYMGDWLRLPWLITDYAKHALFFFSLALFVFKYRTSYYEQQEFNERVRQAYAEARRRYHTNPNEMFEATMSPPDEDDDTPEI